ncbi:Hypothetical predicted protein [Paramuricea clavata]|uniref:Uncharacterized protein n=1 Tax=Paramuricea clavata TaxID=317549 RepID=A0A6S7ITH8_PARCT|nr:Hypothetical predicted protein [Paramuricea clavata]
MKHKRKRRDVTVKQCPNLIGFAGKATVDRRLFPLRMDRRYKSTLEETKRERDAKISQRVKCVQQHKYLTGLMGSLDQQNMDNCNTSLLEELEEKRMTVQRKLNRLDVELVYIKKNMKGL